MASIELDHYSLEFSIKSSLITTQCIILSFINSQYFSIFLALKFFSGPLLSFASLVILDNQNNYGLNNKNLFSPVSVILIGNIVLISSGLCHGIDDKVVNSFSKFWLVEKEEEGIVLKTKDVRTSK